MDKIIILNIEYKHTIQDILAIQSEAYSKEAEIINYKKIPNLFDTEEKIKGSEETFLGYYRNESLLGFLSYKINSKTLDIHRLAINPPFFRQGIADKLLRHLEKTEKDIKRIIVRTGKGNYPAINFYSKKGFKKEREIKIDESLSLFLFSKEVCQTSEL